MSEEILYKVLWIDDDESIVEGTRSVAEDYSLDLVHITNWKDAEKLLKEQFEEFSAIILDANCKLDASQLERELFIPTVMPSLTAIFGEKKKYIPWYILSAGTMANFSFVVESVHLHHISHEEEWGKMLYMKDAEDGKPNSVSVLFENIQRIAKDQAINTILCRNKEVFSYLGEGKLIDSRARKAMLKMLSVLYNPEDNIKYEYAGNPLRKVMEYIFRTARKQGLLSDDCFDDKDHIILLNASRFMAGLEVNCYKGKTITHKVRWGESGDTIFDNDVAMIVKNILNYSSADSHTEEEKPYFVEEENRELFFGYVMQLCHVIKWFGNYVKNHPDVLENKKKIKVSKI